MPRALLTVLLLVSVPSATHAQRAPQEAWAKRCYESTAPVRDKDGEEARRVVILCDTYRHQSGPGSGALLTAALQQTLSQKDGTAVRGDQLRITAPLGSRLNAGVRFRVFRKDEWENPQEERKIPEGHDPARSWDVAYMYCNQDGCVAGVWAPPWLVACLKKGGGLMVETT